MKETHVSVWGKISMDRILLLSCCRIFLLCFLVGIAEECELLCRRSWWWSSCWSPSQSSTEECELPCHRFDEASKLNWRTLFHEVRRSARPTQSAGHGRFRLEKTHKTFRPRSKIQPPPWKASPGSSVVGLQEDNNAAKWSSTFQREAEVRFSSRCGTSCSSSKDAAFNRNSGKRHLFGIKLSLLPPKMCLHYFSSHLPTLLDRHSATLSVGHLGWKFWNLELLESWKLWSFGGFRMSDANYRSLVTSWHWFDFIKVRLLES